MTPLNLGARFSGLRLRPSREVGVPQQFTTESLGLLAVSALKEEALLEFNDPLYHYDSADFVYPESAIHIYLHAEVVDLHPEKVKRGTVMWAINAAAEEMMRTRYLRRMPFAVDFYDENLYSGFVALEYDPAALEAHRTNSSQSAGSTFAPLSLVTHGTNSSIFNLRSPSPLHDYPHYTLSFDFVDSPGSVISDYHIFKTLMALLLKLAPSDAASIIPRIWMQSSAWIFMDEADPPVHNHPFQQYHAVAIVEAISKYYELHGQYREMTFRFYADGRLVAQGCVTKPEEGRIWCAGMSAEVGRKPSADGSSDMVATS